MTGKNLTQAMVARGLLANKKPPDCLAALNNVCAAGAQCPEVQLSPLALQALAALQQATTTVQTSLGNKQALAQALMTAAKVLNLDIGTAKDALGAYEAAVNVVAKKNAAVINKAGLNSRFYTLPSAEVEVVTNLKSVLGKHPCEGIVSWPAVLGATGYALEVNYTPENPAGPWLALISGAGRRRVVKAPTPGAKLLAHVAALGVGNTQSAWSEPILVITAP